MKKTIAWLCIAFLLVTGIACRKEKQEISVYTPDGAPALALAKLMSEDTEADGISYHVVNSTGIEALVQYKEESKNADICILPLTDASLYLHSGEQYALLGTVTHGNFFLLSNQEKYYNEENLSLLIGKKIGVVQLGKLPGLTFRYVLERAGIPYAVKEGTRDVETDKVNLINVAPTSVKANVGFDLFLAPEPLVSLKTKAGFFNVGSLQTLYGEKGYPQATIVAKQSLISKNPEFINDFISNIEENEQWLKEAEPSAVLQAINSHLQDGITPSFTENNLSVEAIAGCNVYFASAEEEKTKINGFISALRTVNEEAVKPLSDKFFYGV